MDVSVRDTNVVYFQDVSPPKLLHLHEVSPFKAVTFRGRAMRGTELLLVSPKSSEKVWGVAQLYLDHVFLVVFGFNLTFLFIKSHPLFCI